MEPADRAETLVRHRRRDVSDLLLHAWVSRSGPTSISSEAAEQHEETERQWSRSKAVIILLIATAFVALLSEFLVGTIESVRDSVGLTEVFVGVIVVAIVGNAAEHSTAVLMAMKNKMDLSVGIAIGSSLQVALFVAPVLIFLSYAFGRPMDLEFTPAGSGRGRGLGLRPVSDQ